VPCDPTKIYFQQQVLPILISNCAMSNCHDDASHKEGVILTSYEKVMNTGGVSPGRPADSELYERIIDTDPDDRMPRPPMSPLTQQQKQLIYQWIMQGAQNLSCQNMCDSTNFSYSGAIKILVSNKCQGCHSGTTASGGIDLSNYNGLKAKVIDGRLWGTINHQAGFSPMPKNGTKLSDCEITQIRKWIEAGSPNN
jgi:mono/diheme cytochrome c family protein